jgi:hypothetical protein
MSGQWVSIPPADFLAKQPYTMQAHSWDSKKLFHWDVCVDCGLVALKNDFSRWCIRIGCHYKDHAGYRDQRGKSGGHK